MNNNDRPVGKREYFLVAFLLLELLLAFGVLLQMAGCFNQFNQFNQ
jgi:hypothetical protein